MDGTMSGQMNETKDRFKPVPTDLDDLAKDVEQAMLRELTPKQKERLMHEAPERMSRKFRNEVHMALMMGMMSSEGFRLELAKEALIKPLEATKQMAAFVPKTVEIEGEVRHHHAIVVPATLSNDAWNEGQNALGCEMEEGWAETSPWGDVQDAVIVKEGE
jgi:hypothetical protein